MKTALFTIVCALLTALPLGALEPASETGPAIERFDKSDIIIRPFIVWENYGFSFLSNNRKTKVRYESNVSMKYGLSAGWYNAGVSFACGPDKPQKKPSRYGTSTCIDASARYFERKYGAEFLYQRHRGFYIENPEEHYSGWEEGDRDHIFSGMTTDHTELIMYYVVLGRRFSYRAPFEQTDRQRRMGGSVVLTGRASYLGINSDGPFLPPDETASFREFDGIKRADMMSFLIEPGYGYTFPLYDFYFTPMVFIGFGGQTQRMSVTGEDISQFTFVFDVSFRATIGYTGERYLAGMSLHGGMTRSHYRGIDIEPSVLDWTFFFGARI